MSKQVESRKKNSLEQEIRPVALTERKRERVGEKERETGIWGGVGEKKRKKR